MRSPLVMKIARFIPRRVRRMIYTVLAANPFRTLDPKHYFALPPDVARETLLTLGKFEPHNFLFHVFQLQAGQVKAMSDAELTARANAYKGLPSLFKIYGDTASYFTNAGHHKTASKLYKAVLDHTPDPQLHSLYLQNLLMSEESTNESLLAAHKEWDRLYCSHIQPLVRQEPDPDPNRKLRIGIVCHFFTAGVSSNVMMPLLRRHNPDRFEIFCYDDGETSQEAKDSTKCHWKDVRGMSDRELAELIAADRIDIVQEANGHCYFNRLVAMAYQPAPIQINWYNHAATTGMRGMTHVTTDDVMVIDADLPYYTEKVYRKHGGFYGSVDLKDKFPGLDLMPPCKKNGYITFGCLGAPHKYSQQAIALWCQVLKAVPSAKMLIKGGVLQFANQHREAFLQSFEANGIPRSRIITEGPSPHAEMIHAFNKVDIMLDTFPVTGGSTLFEALWCGLPPITLRGKRWVSRCATSMLYTVGCPELIAETPEEYVSKAVALAADPERIAKYRRELRDKMAACSLVDMDQFCVDVETAYDTIWREWCAEQQRQAAA